MSDIQYFPTQGLIFLVSSGNSHRIGITASTKPVVLHCGSGISSVSVTWKPDGNAKPGDPPQISSIGNTGEGTQQSVTPSWWFWCTLESENLCCKDLESTLSCTKLFWQQGKPWLWCYSRREVWRGIDWTWDSLLRISFFKHSQVGFFFSFLMSWGKAHTLLCVRKGSGSHLLWVLVSTWSLTNGTLSKSQLLSAYQFLICKHQEIERDHPSLG